MLQLTLLLLLAVLLILSYCNYDNFTNLSGVIVNKNNKYNLVAFVIPIHQPHFKFIYDFLKSNSNTFDVYLIFSSFDEYKLFEMKSSINAIIFDKLETKGIVTYKKWEGLIKIKDFNYEYFIVCDSEIEIKPEYFNPQNVYSKLTHFFNTKKIFGGIVDQIGPISINEQCISIFNDEDKVKLKKLTYNGRLYCWWSDIPVYKKSTLNHFFSIVNHYNPKLNWGHFDNLIYSFYLVLYHNFKFVNLTDEIGLNFSLEVFYTDDINKLNKLKKLGYGFNWAIKKQISNPKVKYFYDNNKTFLIYHLDRF